MQYAEYRELGFESSSAYRVYDQVAASAEYSDSGDARPEEHSIYIIAGFDQVDAVVELTEFPGAHSSSGLMSVRTICTRDESVPQNEVTTALDFAASVVHSSGGRLGIARAEAKEARLSDAFFALGWDAWSNASGEQYLFSPETQLEKPISRYIQPPPGVMLDFGQRGDYKLPAPEYLAVGVEEGWSVAGIPSARSIAHHESQRSADKQVEDRAQSALLARTKGFEASREEGVSGVSANGSWVRMPSPSPTKCDQVWHYTDAGGAIGILKSNALWATNVECLNDSAELHHGFSVIDSVMTKVNESRYVSKIQKKYLEMVIDAARSEQVRRNLFVFCASEAADSLSQWRGYGGGPGYAISMDSNDAPLISTEQDVISSRSTLPPRWMKVVYSPAEQTTLAEEALGFVAHKAPRNLEDSPALKFIVEEDAFYLTGIAACLKHPSFKDEQEVRVLLDASEARSSVEFRPGPYGVTPYVQAVFGDIVVNEGGTPVGVASRKLLPLRSVMVGPSSHPEAAIGGLRVLVGALGVDASIECSAAPFRI